MRGKLSIFLLFLFVANVSFTFAKTVKFRSDSDGYNESFARWARVSGSIGKMPGTDTFGIFANLRFKQDPDDRNSRAQKKLFFIPVDGKMEEEDGKLFYISPSGEKSLLAEKGFLGWNKMDNISVHTRIIREPGRIRLKVEMDID